MSQFSNKRILVIASGNPGKVKEFAKLLPNDILDIISQPKGIDVQEIGNTFRENARLKAIEIANITDQWSLADDSGISVNALNGVPGIHSARYANSDNERVKRLLKDLDLVQDRRATFTSALCIAAPGNNILLEVEGTCEGLITKEPRGQMGFGYDPIFEVLSTGLTYAEMTPAQKQSVSHRGLAFSILLPKLKKLIIHK